MKEKVYGFMKPFEVAGNKRKFSPENDAAIIFRFLVNGIPSSTFRKILEIVEIYDNLSDTTYHSEDAINRFLHPERYEEER